MQYGSGPLNKYEYACTAAVSLAYLLLRQQDAVGCISFDEKTRNTVPLKPNFEPKRNFDLDRDEDPLGFLSPDREGAQVLPGLGARLRGLDKPADKGGEAALSCIEQVHALRAAGKD